MLKYEIQQMPSRIVASSDIVSAGCTRTRRSASGGVVIFGRYCIKSYSHTQDILALSPGVSGIYGVVRADAVGPGVVGVMKDLGVKVQLQ